MALQTAIDLTGKLPATFTMPGLSEREFLDLVQEYPDCFLEYTADGTVIIMPPTDPESSEREGEVCVQLFEWGRRNDRGVSGPSAGFYFADGSRRSPSAALFNSERLGQAKSRGTRFPV